MANNYIVDIPEFSKISGITDIPYTGDLSSVLLYKEAFTLFEEDVIRSNSDWPGYHLREHRQPLHWDKSHWPDETSFDYICDVFRSHLPSLQDLRTAASFHGSSLALVGGGSCLKGMGNADLIDSHDIVLRLNHPYLEECFEDVGTRTTIHMINERRTYNLISGTPKENFYPMGVLNILTGSTSETATLLEYARFLDSGGEPSKYFVLKPSFSKTLEVIHDKHNPSLGWKAVGFALRVFNNTTIFGFDLGRGSGSHYHGREKLHPAHSPQFEGRSFLECHRVRDGFSIHSRS